jgi:hypothetical protein
MLQETLKFEQSPSSDVADIEQAGAISIRHIRTSRPEVLLVGEPT